MSEIKKPFFETEEEYRNFVKEMGFFVPQTHEAKAKELGYIRHKPVEEAEKIISEIYPVLLKAVSGKCEIFFIKNEPFIITDIEVTRGLYDIEYTIKFKHKGDNI